jgi:hypothetical protein
MTYSFTILRIDEVHPLFHHQITPCRDFKQSLVVLDYSFAQLERRHVNNKSVWTFQRFENP